MSVLTPLETLYNSGLGAGQTFAPDHRLWSTLPGEIGAAVLGPPARRKQSSNAIVGKDMPCPIVLVP